MGQAVCLSLIVVLAGICSTSALLTGYRTAHCEYDGRKHYTGSYWSLGCDVVCRCVFGPANATVCYNRCPQFQTPLPRGCQLAVTQGRCCPQPQCEWFEKCRSKGKWYDQDEEWDDECYRCRCTDAKKSMIQCHYNCPFLGLIPHNCKVVKVPGKCCRELQCTTGPKNSVTTARPRPHPGNTTSGGLTIITGNYKNCFYNGTQYNQTDTWDLGCTKTCECVNPARNHIRCTDKCYSWTLPSACKMIAPKPGKCCRTPSCPAGYRIYYPPGYKEE